MLQCWVESLAVCDCWCFIKLCVEPLFCQSCHWHDGLCHIAHVEGNNQCLLVGVVHVHLFVTIHWDVFICCCPEFRTLSLKWIQWCVWCEPCWANVCCCTTVDHDLCLCVSSWLLNCLHSCYCFLVGTRCLLAQCCHKLDYWCLIVCWWCWQSLLLLLLLSLLLLLLLLSWMSVVVAWLVVAVPIVVIPIAWVIPLCCSILVLFLRCLWHVVHCRSAILCHVAWLATSVAHCCWILPFSFVGHSFCLSFVAFVSGFWVVPWLLFSSGLSFVVCAVASVAFSLLVSFSFVALAISLSFVLSFSFSFAFVCCSNVHWGWASSKVCADWWRRQLLESWERCCSPVVLYDYCPHLCICGWCACVELKMLLKWSCCLIHENSYFHLVWKLCIAVTLIACQPAQIPMLRRTLQSCCCRNLVWGVVWGSLCFLFQQVLQTCCKAVCRLLGPWRLGVVCTLLLRRWWFWWGCIWGWTHSCVHFSPS